MAWQTWLNKDRPRRAVPPLTTSNNILLASVTALQKLTDGKKKEKITQKILLTFATLLLKGTEEDGKNKFNLN